MRTLWIMRLSAAASENGTNYSGLMTLLKKAKIELNRKVLADIAVRDNGAFLKIVETAKKAT